MTPEQISIVQALCRCPLRPNSPERSWLRKVVPLADPSVNVQLAREDQRSLEQYAFRYRKHTVMADLLERLQPAEPKTMLHWMARDLVEAGLLKNEHWVEDHVVEATRMFADQRLHVPATIIAAMDERGLDYLRSAPVLAVIVPGDSNLSFTYGRQHLACRLKDRMRGGPKLRQLMEREGVHYQLRVLSADALQVADRISLSALMGMPPSTLAQAVPNHSNDQQQWLLGLSQWSAAFAAVPRGRPGHLWWAAEKMTRAGCPVSQARTIADFVAHSGVPLNERWTWQRAHEEAMAWHGRLGQNPNAGMKLTIQCDPTALVDYGALPKRIRFGAYRFVALRNGTELFEEGRAMKHCVAAYLPQIWDGTARIYSLQTIEGKRLATIEIARFGDSMHDDGWCCSQAQGPCNGVLPPDLVRTVDRFVQYINEKSAKEAA